MLFIAAEHTPRLLEYIRKARAFLADPEADGRRGLRGGYVDAAMRHKRYQRIRDKLLRAEDRWRDCGSTTNEQHTAAWRLASIFDKALRYVCDPYLPPLTIPKAIRLCDLERDV
jgi:hypothetical protein